MPINHLVTRLQGTKGEVVLSQPFYSIHKYNCKVLSPRLLHLLVFTFFFFANSLSIRHIPVVHVRSHAYHEFRPVMKAQIDCITYVAYLENIERYFHKFLAGRGAQLDH